MHVSRLAVSAVVALGLGVATGVGVGSSTASRAAAAPVNTSPPTISGTRQQNQKLSASTGSWTGDATISYAFVWQRCSSSGSSCGDISGATGTTYTLGSSDVGKTIRIVVTASNSAGRASAASSPTGTIAAAGTAPSATKQPNPHGSAQVGQTVTVDNGSWSGTTPITYRLPVAALHDRRDLHRHRRRDEVLVRAGRGDIGYRLRATVTARNSVGSASIASNLTAAVIAGSLGPGEHLQADRQRPQRDRRQHRHGLDRQLGRHPADLLQLQLEPLRQHRQPLPDDRRRLRADLRAHLGRRRLDDRVRRQGLELGRIVGRRLRADTGGHQPAGRRGPAGATGRVSIPASSVSLPHRLVISAVHFSRRPLRSRHAFTGRFRITDTRGYLVRDARVRAAGIPYGWITAHRGHNRDQRLRRHQLHPTRHLPLQKGDALVVFIRARKPGDSTQAGESAHRLVQVALAPPRRR